MRVLVTGAGGFVGRHLVARLLAERRIGPDAPPIETLILSDLNLSRVQGDLSWVTRIEGSLVEPATRTRLLDQPVDLLFHLAALPGGEAERRNDLGWAVNRDAMQSLMESLAAQGRGARVIYASTIGVFGVPLPERIDDGTLPLPTMSYSAQKLMAEIFLVDLTRRGRLDARVPRLPGRVPRPPQGDGLVSAFLSGLFHAAAAGTSLALPVSPSATVWLMSLSRCVDNLLHAAGIEPEKLPARRAWTLPALRLSLAEILAEVSAALGEGATRGIRFEPIPAVKAQFGCYPPLDTPMADAIGFRSDGDAASLVRHVLFDLHAATDKGHYHW